MIVWAGCVLFFVAGILACASVTYGLFKEWAQAFRGAALALLALAAGIAFITGGLSA